MWDSGLIDEKLEFELSRDDNVLALRTQKWHERYSLQHTEHGSFEKPGITSRPPPFHSSKLEISKIRHQVHFSQYKSLSFFLFLIHVLHLDVTLWVMI